MPFAFKGINNRAEMEIKLADAFMTQKKKQKLTACFAINKAQDRHPFKGNTSVLKWSIKSYAYHKKL